MTQRFNYGLNGLRGVACIVVLLFHCCLVFRFNGMDHTDALYPKFFSVPDSFLSIILMLINGPACVTLFFTLSGVVLALSLNNDVPTQKKILLSYWVKRLSRLYPLLILSVVVSAAVQVLLFRHQHFQTVTTWLNDAYRIDLTPKVLFKNLVGASASLNSPAWSIKIEILESLIFPATYLLSRHKTSAIVTLIALLALMASAHGTGSTFDNIRLATICFFVGALIPRWSAPVAGWFSRLPPAARSAMVVATIALFCCSEWDRQSAVSRQFFLELITSTFIIIVVYHRPAGRLAKAAFVRTLGEISYSIYLLHMPILLTMAYCMVSIKDNPAALSWAPATLVLATLTLLFTLPSAYLCYTYF